MRLVVLVESSEWLQLPHAIMRIIGAVTDMNIQPSITLLCHDPV